LNAARVLIVEDESAFADVVSEFLSDEGFSVVRARNGITALNMLNAGRLSPDVIVCDVMLPGLRGDRLAAQVRRRFPNRRLPIVLLSASTDPGVRLRDVWFMAKPFDFRDLLKMIERVLEPRPRVGSAAV
jgi:CheY-like chemotaxis protein